MVFLTRLLQHGRDLCTGVDRYFKTHQRFRLAWRYEGRSRNVNRITRIAYMRSLRFAFWARNQKGRVNRQLYDTRLEGAATEHGMSRLELLEGLARCDVGLDRKVLQDLAIYEPRTFKSLCELSKTRLVEEEISAFDTSATTAGVVTRGLLNRPLQPDETGQS